MTTERKFDPVLMDLPMPIYTPRLIIRPAGPGDGAELFAAKMETIDELQRWMPWAKDIGTPEDSEAIVRKAYTRFLLREDFMMTACLRETGQPVIFTGLHRFDWDLRRMEIGYWCRKGIQGQGYVTETVNALTRYAFNVLDARAVAIDMAHDNEKSRAVAERLGFTFEGRLRHAMLTPDGLVHDELVYSRTGIETLPPMAITWGGP